jgi:outer membrane protein assembly factor BamD (BamD/ComL family)
MRCMILIMSTCFFYILIYSLMNFQNNVCDLKVMLNKLYFKKLYSVDKDDLESANKKLNKLLSKFLFDESKCVEYIEKQIKTKNDDPDFSYIVEKCIDDNFFSFLSRFSL